MSLKFPKPLVLSARRSSKSVDGCIEGRPTIFPIKINLLLLIAALSMGCCMGTNKKFTIMLSPEGDAINTGRALTDGFERGFARQLAESVKERLERDNTLRIILSHETGEQINQEQKANFANRLNVDLYVAIGLYTTNKPTIASYYYKTELFEPLIDNRLALYPTTQAHVAHATKTRTLAAHGFINTRFNSQFSVQTPIGIPLKQLEGVTAPAFMVEVGITRITDLYAYIDPLVESLTEIAHAENH